MDEEISETIDIFVLNQAKFLQKVVQEIDGLKYAFIHHHLEEENEEVPPLPEKFISPRELTPQQVEAVNMYDRAVQLLNKTKPEKQQAYNLLLQSANLGNDDAKALVAWGYLFGNPLPHNINEAKNMFLELGENGHPEGHMGLGFMYGSGIALNVSQTRALVHYTFAAIGGNTWAQMVLGYRYFSGITVPTSCEKALDFYRLIAENGKRTFPFVHDDHVFLLVVSGGVSFGGGAAIQRIRLLDELENGYTTGILDNDLIEYYQLLAEKGDIQAQVRLNYCGHDIDTRYVSCTSFG